MVLKKLFIFFIFLKSVQVCFGQTPFSFNQGGTKEATYFTSFSYENVQGKVILKTKIKDKFYRFMLDTGAPTAMSFKLFNELNLPLISQIPILDSNGVQDSLSVVKVTSIGIGEVVFEDIPALVIKENIVFSCYEVDGIIGSNLLRNSIIQIDSRNREIRLSSDNSKLSLSPKHSTDLILDKQSSPIISVFLKNKNKVKEQLLVDLGMDGLYDLSLNHFNLFKENKIFTKLNSSRGSNQMGLFGMAKDTTHYRLLIPQLEIGGAKILNVFTQTTTDENSRIGCEILEYGLLTIDYKNRKFYCAPFNENHEKKDENKFPVDFIPFNNGLYVGFVWDDKLVNVISFGDKVISINETNYEDVTFCNVMFNRRKLKEMKSVKLVIKKPDGKIVEVII